jgi:hypothetical protein
MQLEHMRKNCPALKELSLKCNPIAAKKLYRQICFERIRTLQTLDQAQISEKDKVLAWQGFNTQTLSPDVILSCIRKHNPSSKNLYSIDDEEDGDWERSIE